MKIRLSKILASLSLFTLMAPIALASFYTTDEGCRHPFIDTIGHYAEEAICHWYSEDVVEGHSERNFLPNQAISRAEAVKVFTLSLGFVPYSVQSEEFTDIKPGDWHYQYLTFARSQGFIEGYPDGSFRPDKSITRAEALQIIINIAGIINYNLPHSDPPFYDVNEDDWFYTAVTAAYHNDIIEGLNKISFGPHNEMTRADATLIALRVWDNFYDIQE